MARAFLLLILTAFCVAGCDDNAVFDHYQSLPNQWHKDSIVTFKVTDIDSLQSYNLFINISNTDDYPFSNLYLITQMIYPHGKVVQDTLEYEMASSNGEWMGVGLGEAKWSKLWYKENIQFPEQGTYTFKFRQAMRRIGEKDGLKLLKGITEVGLRIENTNQSKSARRE